MFVLFAVTIARAVGEMVASTTLDCWDADAKLDMASISMCAAVAAGCAVVVYYLEPGSEPIVPLEQYTVAKQAAMYARNLLGGNTQDHATLSATKKAGKAACEMAHSKSGRG